jgi:hypothetical protein
MDNGQGFRPRMGRPPWLKPLGFNSKEGALKFGRYFVPTTLGFVGKPSSRAQT